MSLFASLFGSGGSDKADKMRQAAIDAFGSIKTPELSALQVQLNDYVNAGKLTPEQAEAQLLGSNAFNAIKSDPNATGAQKMALNQLQDIGSKGGMTAIDRAQLQDITNQQNQEANSRNQAVMQQAQQRGVGNSDLNTVNQLLNEQGAADRASQAGTNVAANAQQRALQAIQSAGALGGQIEGQQYGEQANKAQSQNAIDQFNSTTQNQFNMANVQAANQAQAANLANAQDVANKNTETQNANRAYNAQQNQTVFNDQLQKANGVAGQYTNWANSAQDQANKEQGANVGLTSGLISAGAAAASPIAGAFGAGANAASGMESAPAGYKPKMAANQSASLGYADGGLVINKNQHYVDGPDGHMLIEDRVPSANADALKDLAHFTDPAKLHAKAITNGQDPTKPAELAMKRPIEDEFSEFVKKYCYGGTVNMADGGTVTIKPGKDSKKTTARDLPIVSAADGKDWTLKDPHNDPIGDFNSYADAVAYAEKVKEKQPHVDDFKSGGRVPGMPVVPGDSPKNDIVPAKLSPGEIVIPRSAAHSPESAAKFVKKTKAFDPMEDALKRLSNPGGR